MVVMPIPPACCSCIPLGSDIPGAATTITCTGCCCGCCTVVVVVGTGVRNGIVDGC